MVFEMIEIKILLEIVKKISNIKSYMNSNFPQITIISVSLTILFSLFYMMYSARENEEEACYDKVKMIENIGSTSCGSDKYYSQIIQDFNGLYLHCVCKN